MEYFAAVPCGAARRQVNQMCDRPDGCYESHLYCDVATMWCVMEDPLIVCGIDAQCPTGTFCCPFTNTCLSPDRPLSCTLPPEGASTPCTDDIDCQRMDGSYWDINQQLYFCDGPGCGPGGGCFLIPGLHDCTNVAEPVCGCDGVTYTNECRAHQARVRVSHSGPCWS